MSPPTKEVIETERLRLIRISDTSLDGDHLKWFHETWSDPVATSWSLHGKCSTLEESQDWFTVHLKTYDAITYIIFSRFSADGAELPFPGEVIGNMCLRTQAAGASLPPFSRAKKPLNLRSMGYSFLQKAWGKGYATEAGRAVLDAYREGTREAREKGDEVYYVEAIWGEGNPASGRVLGKLGFREIGYKEEEKVWLAGAWRYGYIVSGWYV
ncbi:acyl-CoA N-acyltransferase [Karstenula rhodostoma CBS 690.94]|uniref:Acyl-CoA N-acyltransferase n=1 Tax=Karstenula rhodostoma CBS 690.94 TaxID=1392251 RepID=A0A9P4PUH3_9PLEO|nr:acyl-CoA N-acyltransferase [Karstenula rhodostoma CBS 690.94]